MQGRVVGPDIRRKNDGERVLVACRNIGCQITGNPADDMVLGKQLFLRGRCIGDDGDICLDIAGLGFTADDFQNVRGLGLRPDRLDAILGGECLGLLDNLAGGIINVDGRFLLCCCNQGVEIKRLGG